MRSRATVKAVWDNDLETLLGSLGILPDLLAGEMKCAICSNVVTLDNLGTIFSNQGKILVTCDNTVCVHAVTSTERGVTEG